MRTTVPTVRTLVLIFVFFFSTLTSHSQAISTGDGKLEIGIGVGPLVFLGDLGGNYGEGTKFLKDVNMSAINVSKGLFLNYYPAEWIGLRLSVNHGQLEGYDSLIVDKGGAEIHRKDRNLQFRSSLLEAYGAVEFYPTVFMERYEGLAGKLRPYGLAGVGVFRFNPQGAYYAPDGSITWVDLKPLRLEGQGMAETGRGEYSLTAINFLMGFGFKYYMNDNLYVGFEVLHRETTTDYIDDVSKDYIDPLLFDRYLTPEQSQMARQLYNRQGFGHQNASQTRPMIGEQRGNPKNTDSYFSSVLRLGWRFNDNSSYGGRASKQVRCPNY